VSRQTYQEYLENPHAFDPLQRRVSRLRDALWRGKSWQALLQFAWLRGDIDRWAASHQGHCADSVRRARQVTSKRFDTTCVETAEASLTLQNNVRRGIASQPRTWNPS
jgi:hypothetical protein